MFITIKLVNISFTWHNYHFVVVVMVRPLQREHPTVCDPKYCGPPGSSLNGIFQARILEWVVVSFCKGSSQSKDQIWVSCIAGRFFTVWATREAPTIVTMIYITPPDSIHKFVPLTYMSPFPPNPHSTFCFFESDFFRFHIYTSEIIQHLSFSVWLISLDMNNDKCHCDKCWWFCLLRIYFHFFRDYLADVSSWNEYFLCAVAGGTRDGGVQ